MPTLKRQTLCPLRIRCADDRAVECEGLQIPIRKDIGGSNPSRHSILFLYTHADVLKYYLIYSVVRHMS